MTDTPSLTEGQQLREKLGNLTNHEWKLLELIPKSVRMAGASVVLRSNSIQGLHFAFHTLQLRLSLLQRIEGGEIEGLLHFLRNNSAILLNGYLIIGDYSTLADCYGLKLKKWSKDAARQAMYSSCDLARDLDDAVDSLLRITAVKGEVK